jgi:Kef-type K+ transport system membrane component KefB
VLNVLGWPLFATPEPGPGQTAPDLLAVIRDLADVGVLLLMFVAGLETDLAEMRRVGKVAFWAAFGGVVLPMAGGIATAVLFGLPLYWEAIFIGVILTATSVSISAQTLMEIGALRTREGATILGAAVIDDVMGIIVLSFVVAFARAAGVAPISAAWRSSSSGWRRISRLTFPRRPVTGDAIEETVGHVPRGPA